MSLRTITFILFSTIIICFTSILSHSQERLLELTGQVFFSESDEPVADVEVKVSGTDRKTFTNDNGNFSIVVRPEDKIIFSGIGLINSTYQVPAQVEGNFIVISQKIDIDTTFYEEIVITKYLSKEEFDFLMKYGYIPDENLLASRKNMSEENRNSFIQNSPLSYYENQLILQQSIQNRYGSYYGQQPQTGGINPFEWYDFFKNWKKNMKRQKDK